MKIAVTYEVIFTIESNNKNFDVSVRKAEKIAEAILNKLECTYVQIGAD